MNELIRAYTGIHIADQLTGMARECYLSCWEWMKYAWGDNVEFERLKEQVLYCKATRDYLYDKKPKSVQYVRGSRPYLEKIVDNICKECVTEREKVLAILVYVRDLHKKFGCRDYFYGGTEEELIKKGEWYCERVSRLMVGLCEIAGFPGRIIFHIASGHLTVEIYFEGKWAYFDPRCGMFCVDKQGRFLSVEEILNDREIIFKQSDWVNRYHAPYWSLDYRQHRNYYFCFNPRELQCYVEYSLMDADKYHFEWVSTYESKAPAGERTPHSRYTETGMMLLIN